MNNNSSIVVASGCWQVLQATAGLNCINGHKSISSVVLLLFNPGGRLTGYEREMEEFAQRCYNWAEIYWISELIVPPLPSEKAVDSGIELLTAFMRDRGLKPSVVWVTGIHRQYEKIILATCPNAAINLYEDGLASYYNHEYTCGIKRLANLSISRWPGALKREIGHRRVVGECSYLLGVCAKDVARVKCACLSLTRLVPVPEYLLNVDIVDVSAELRDVIKRMACMCANELDAQIVSENNSVMVLGTPLYYTGKIGWEEELEIYQNICREIVEAGYCVIWKDHPRNKRPFFQHLKKLSFPVAQCCSRLSVELFLLNQRVVAIVGNFSTSLFNAQQLFNIPCYTYYRPEWNDIFNEYDAWTARLVHEKIPHYKQLKKRCDNSE